MKKVISNNIEKLIFSYLLLIFSCSNNKDTLNENNKKNNIY